MGDDTKKYPWSVAFRSLLIQQLVEAVGALHDADIAHLDLKPNNILFDEDLRLYLSDFSGAKDLTNAKELFLCPKVFTLSRAPMHVTFKNGKMDSKH